MARKYFLAILRLSHRGVMKELEISKVLNLAKIKKYEVACASFDLIDHIFKIEIPRSMKTRKLAVQAMSLLVDGNVQYGYDLPSQRAAKVAKEKAN